MIDKEKLITDIQGLVVVQTSVDGRNHQDELINSYNEALFDVLKTIEEQPKDHDLEWYKHDYYAECDRAERLEKALDKACVELERWDIRNFDSPDISITKEEWKEELLQDGE